MGKFRKKPVVIDATQWFENGDHPQDDIYLMSPEGRFTEGKVVRYFRHPEIDGTEVCQYCRRILRAHGWIDTLEGGHIVCPGDWVITGVRGEHYPCKPDIFDETYEAA